LIAQKRIEKIEEKKEIEEEKEKEKR